MVLRSKTKQIIHFSSYTELTSPHVVPPLQLVAAALVVVLAVAAAVNGLPDGYRKEQLGRVKIQVYRGPSKNKGYHSFAPWGYYFTQPEDKKKGYH